MHPLDAIMAGSQAKPQGRARPVALFVTAAPILFVCWLVFVGSFDKWELSLGGAAAAAGALAVCLVERADRSHFAPRLRDWLQIAWIPWLLVQGTFEIIAAALRDALGGRPAAPLFRIARFDPGKPDDPTDTGRRVLAVTYMTMTPTSIVLGVNARRKHLLVHQFERGGMPRLAKNLGVSG